MIVTHGRYIRGQIDRRQLPFMQLIDGIPHRTDHVEEPDPLIFTHQLDQEDRPVFLKGPHHGRKDIQFQTLHIAFDKIQPGQIEEQPVALATTMRSPNN